MSVEWTELSDYLAGELDTATEAALEQDLFESPDASAVVRAFLATVDGIAVLQREHGTLSGVLRPEHLETMRRRHDLVEITVAPGSTADCPIGEDTGYVVAHLPVAPAALEDAERLDLEYANGRGEVYARVKDVYVDREAGRVIVACERHVALMEALTVFRLVAVRRGKDRLVSTHGAMNVPPVA